MLRFVCCTVAFPPTLSCTLPRCQHNLLRHICLLLQMTGFFAATIGELITGKGALGQLALETNLPPGVVKAVVAGIVIFNAITALNPAGTTFSEENQADVRKRPKGTPLPLPSNDPLAGPKVILTQGLGQPRSSQ